MRIVKKIAVFRFSDRVQHKLICSVREQRRRQEAGNFRFREERDCALSIVKQTWKVNQYSFKNKQNRYPLPVDFLEQK